MPQQGSTTEQDALVFDVNETLLDVGTMAPAFRETVGSDALLPIWFARMLRDSLLATVTASYRRFDELGTSALRAVAREAGVELNVPAAANVVDRMRSLPAHPDVPGALERLAGAGFRLATLTNSAPDVIADQLRNAGLDQYFEQLVSVDDVRVFKPHPATYAHAATQLGTHVGGVRLVAAHDWDVVGAIRAGARAAYVARNTPLSADPAETPDIIAPDLGGIADRLIDG